MKFNMHEQHLPSAQPCVYNDNCTFNEFCMGEFCACKPNYERVNGICVQCPGLGDQCSTCCYLGLTCIGDSCVCSGDNSYYSICHGQNGVFVTASQIALSAALVMGIAALVMVIYRLCTKPRYLSVRHQRVSQRLSEFSNTRRGNFLRASLSSIQIRVLSRLRDRPPPYDSQGGPRTVSQSIERQSVGTNIPEPPPPYEARETEIIDTHLPPPYTEVIISPGYLNPSFASTERTTNLSQIAQSPEFKVTRSEA